MVLGIQTAINFILRKKKLRSKVLGVIPARYDSTRYPGKPLVMIAGKPMIQRTWEQAMKCKKCDKIVVATDDERIKNVCEGFGATVVMTAYDIPNGTERCNAAQLKLAEKYDIVVNIQGDEPLIEPEIVDAVVEALQQSPDAVYSTACTTLAHEEVKNLGRVKCVTDKDGYAIYFSRGMIPCNKKGEVNPKVQYKLHLGLQCYDASFLKVYGDLPSTPLQLEEDLEQLKCLENGYKIKVIMVDHCAHGVDNPEDVPSVEKIIKENPHLFS